MAWFAWAPIPASAMIFYTTGDPTFNTTAPTGALVDSGWQWQGNWQGFSGTPIGPHHFIAAAHVGGAVGDLFVLNDVGYTTVSSVHDPLTDLTLWEVAGTFPSWAPLYQGGDEAGKPLVVFGRGLVRGSEIRVNGVLKGWSWTGAMGTLRWGENRVSAVTAYGSVTGALLYATFDAGAGANEAHLALGDSSGAVFLKEDGVWKLAGIAYAVDAYFNMTNVGDGFNAALFDASGLYYGSNGAWQLVSAHVPTGFYATRISTRRIWIESVVPPVVEDVPLLDGVHLGAVAVFLFVAGCLALQPRLA